jgi:hypothetical protein
MSRSVRLALNFHLAMAHRKGEATRTPLQAPSLSDQGVYIGGVPQPKNGGMSAAHG